MVCWGFSKRLWFKLAALVTCITFFVTQLELGWAGEYLFAGKPQAAGRIPQTNYSWVIKAANMQVVSKMHEKVAVEKRKKEVEREAVIERAAFQFDFNKFVAAKQMLEFAQRTLAHHEEIAQRIGGLFTYMVEDTPEGPMKYYFGPAGTEFAGLYKAEGWVLGNSGQRMWMEARYWNDRATGRTRERSEEKFFQNGQLALTINTTFSGYTSTDGFGGGKNPTNVKQEIINHIEGTRSWIETTNRYEGEQLAESWERITNDYSPIETSIHTYDIKPDGTMTKEIEETGRDAQGNVVVQRKYKEEYYSIDYKDVHGQKTLSGWKKKVTEFTDNPQEPEISYVESMEMNLDEFGRSVFSKRTVEDRFGNVTEEITSGVAYGGSGKESWNIRVNEYAKDEEGNLVIVNWRNESYSNAAYKGEKMQSYRRTITEAGKEGTLTEDYSDVVYKGENLVSYKLAQNYSYEIEGEVQTTTEIVEASYEVDEFGRILKSVIDTKTPEGAVVPKDETTIVEYGDYHINGRVADRHIENRVNNITGQALTREVTTTYRNDIILAMHEEITDSFTDVKRTVDIAYTVGADGKPTSITETARSYTPDGSYDVTTTETTTILKREYGRVAESEIVRTSTATPDKIDYYRNYVTYDEAGREKEARREYCWGTAEEGLEAIKAKKPQIETSVTKYDLFNRPIWSKCTVEDKFGNATEEITSGIIYTAAGRSAWNLRVNEYTRDEEGNLVLANWRNETYSDVSYRGEKMQAYRKVITQAGLQDVITEDYSDITYKGDILTGYHLIRNCSGGIPGEMIEINEIADASFDVDSSGRMRSSTVRTKTPEGAAVPRDETVTIAYTGYYKDGETPDKYTETTTDNISGRVVTRKVDTNFEEDVVVGTHEEIADSFVDILRTIDTSYAIGADGKPTTTTEASRVYTADGTYDVTTTTVTGVLKREYGKVTESEAVQTSTAAPDKINYYHNYVTYDAVGREKEVKREYRWGTAEEGIGAIREKAPQTTVTSTKYDLYSRPTETVETAIDQFGVRTQRVMTAIPGQSSITEIRFNELELPEGARGLTQFADGRYETSQAQYDTYNALGQLTHYNVEEKTYDEKGNFTGAKQSELFLSYDDLGRLTGQATKTTEGGRASWIYEEFSDFNAWGDAAKITRTMVGADGEPRTETLMKGYDKYGREGSLTLQWSGAGGYGTVNYTDYKYDRLGQIESRRVTDTNPQGWEVPVTGGADYNESYKYDGYGRACEINQSGSYQGPDGATSFTQKFTSVYVGSRIDETHLARDDTTADGRVKLHTDVSTTNTYKNGLLTYTYRDKNQTETRLSQEVVRIAIFPIPVNVTTTIRRNETSVRYDCEYNEFAQLTSYREGAGFTESMRRSAVFPDGTVREADHEAERITSKSVSKTSCTYDPATHLLAQESQSTKGYKQNLAGSLLTTNADSTSLYNEDGKVVYNSSRNYQLGTMPTGERLETETVAFASNTYNPDGTLASTTDVTVDLMLPAAGETYTDPVSGAAYTGEVTTVIKSDIVRQPGKVTYKEAEITTEHRYLKDIYATIAGKEVKVATIVAFDPAGFEVRKDRQVAVMLDSRGRAAGRETIETLPEISKETGRPTGNLETRKIIETNTYDKYGRPLSATVTQYRWDGAAWSTRDKDGNEMQPQSVTNYSFNFFDQVTSKSGITNIKYNSHGDPTSQNVITDTTGTLTITYNEAGEEITTNYYAYKPRTRKQAGYIINLVTDYLGNERYRYEQILQPKKHFFQRAFGKALLGIVKAVVSVVGTVLGGWGLLAAAVLNTVIDSAANYAITGKWNWRGFATNLGVNLLATYMGGGNNLFGGANFQAVSEAFTSGLKGFATQIGAQAARNIASTFTSEWVAREATSHGWNAFWTGFASAAAGATAGAIGGGITTAFFENPNMFSVDTARCIGDSVYSTFTAGNVTAWGMFASSALQVMQWGVSGWQNYDVQRYQDKITRMVEEGTMTREEAEKALSRRQDLWGAIVGVFNIISTVVARFVDAKVNKVIGGYDSQKMHFDNFFALIFNRGSNREGSFDVKGGRIGGTGMTLEEFAGRYGLSTDENKKLLETFKDGRFEYKFADGRTVKAEFKLENINIETAFFANLPFAKDNKVIIRNAFTAGLNGKGLEALSKALLKGNVTIDLVKEETRIQVSSELIAQKSTGGNGWNCLLDLAGASFELGIGYGGRNNGKLTLHVTGDGTHLMALATSPAFTNENAAAGINELFSQIKRKEIEDLQRIKVKLSSDEAGNVGAQARMRLEGLDDKGVVFKHAKNTFRLRANAELLVTMDVLGNLAYLTEKDRKTIAAALTRGSRMNPAGDAAQYMLYDRRGRPREMVDGKTGKEIARYKMIRAAAMKKAFESQDALRAIKDGARVSFEEWSKNYSIDTLSAFVDKDGNVYAYSVEISGTLEGRFAGALYPAGNIGRIHAYYDGLSGSANVTDYKGKLLFTQDSTGMVTTMTIEKVRGEKVPIPASIHTKDGRKLGDYTIKDLEGLEKGILEYRGLVPLIPGTDVFIEIPGSISYNYLSGEYSILDSAELAVRLATEIEPKAVSKERPSAVSAIAKTVNDFKDIGSEYLYRAKDYVSELGTELIMKPIEIRYKMYISSVNDENLDSISRGIAAFKAAGLMQSFGLGTTAAEELIGSVISFANSLSPEERSAPGMTNSYDMALSSLAFITKVYPDLKERIINYLRLDETRAQIYRDFGVIMVEERGTFSDIELGLIRNALAAVPEFLPYVGIIKYQRWEDSDWDMMAGCYGNIGISYHDMGFLMGTPEEENFERYFPADTPGSGVKAVSYTTALMHEIGHCKDDVALRQYSGSNTLFCKLSKQSGLDIENYALGYPITHYTSGKEELIKFAPAEDFATTIAGWVADSVFGLETGISRAEQEKPLLLEKLLIAADVFSFKGADGKEYTTVFKADLKGNIYREELPIERDVHGIISKIGDIAIRPEWKKDMYEGITDLTTDLVAYNYPGTEYPIPDRAKMAKTLGFKIEPEAVSSSLFQAGFTKDEASDLLTAVKSAAGVYKSWAYRALPDAVNALLKAGYTKDQTLDLLMAVKNAAGEHTAWAYRALPSLLQAGLTDNQILDLLTAVKNAAGKYTGDAYLYLPSLAGAIKGRPYTEVRRGLIFITKYSGSAVGKVYEITGASNIDIAKCTTKADFAKEYASALNRLAQEKSQSGSVWQKIAVSINTIHNREDELDKTDIIRETIAGSLDTETIYYLFSLGGAVLYPSVFPKIYEQLIKDPGFLGKIKKIDPNRTYAVDFLLTLADFDKLNDVLRRDPECYFIDTIKYALSDAPNLLRNGMLLVTTFGEIFAGGGYLSKYKAQFEEITLEKYAEYSKLPDKEPMAVIGYLIKITCDNFSDKNKGKAEAIAAALPEMLEPKVPGSWLKDNAITAKLYFYSDEGHYELAKDMYHNIFGFSEPEKIKKDTWLLTKRLPTGTVLKVIVTLDNRDVAESIKDPDIDIIAHRGHSYHLDETFDTSLGSLARDKMKLLYMGSCKSFREIAGLLKAGYGGNYFISNEAVGRGTVNNYVLYYLMEAAAIGIKSFPDIKEYVTRCAPRTQDTGIVYPQDKQMLVWDFVEKVKKGQR